MTCTSCIPPSLTCAVGCFFLARPTAALADAIYVYTASPLESNSNQHNEKTIDGKYFDPIQIHQLSTICASANVQLPSRT